MSLLYKLFNDWWCACGFTMIYDFIFYYYDGLWRIKVLVFNLTIWTLYMFHHGDQKANSCRMWYHVLAVTFRMWSTDTGKAFFTPMISKAANKMPRRLPFITWFLLRLCNWRDRNSCSVDMSQKTHQRKCKSIPWHQGTRENRENCEFHSNVDDFWSKQTKKSVHS